MQYSRELKDALIRRMLHPNNEAISKISKEEGVSEQTLRNWRDNARANGIAAPENDAVADKWSTQDKFLIVVETASINEIELAEYARQKGLYVEQIQAWKDTCMNANGGVAKEASRLNKKLKISEKENKRLEKELTRKEKTLAETAALLVLRKKPMRSGGSGGRMISTSDRSKAIELISEAVTGGARLFKACKELGITERTYYRWVKQLNTLGTVEDLRLITESPEPANKLSIEEHQRIIDTVNQLEYASMPPCEIVPALADQGEYIASESTFYRVLREHKMQNHRGRSEEPQHRPISTHRATGPNQVRMWDITYLNGSVKGNFYYLYLISDLFSRDIVGWDVWEEETAEHAGELIKRTSLAQHVLSTNTLVLHSDNGSPMK